MPTLKLQMGPNLMRPPSARITGQQAVLLKRETSRSGGFQKFAPLTVTFIPSGIETINFWIIDKGRPETKLSVFPQQPTSTNQPRLGKHRNSPLPQLQVCCSSRCQRHSPEVQDVAHRRSACQHLRPKQTTSRQNI